jgi:hypothetical protein
MPLLYGVQQPWPLDVLYLASQAKSSIKYHDVASVISHVGIVSRAALDKDARIYIVLYSYVTIKSLVTMATGDMVSLLSLGQSDEFLGLSLTPRGPKLFGNY